MVRQALIFASIFSALIVLSIFGYSAWQQRVEFNKLKTELSELKEAAKENSLQSATLRDQLTNSQARIEALIREKEAVTHAQQAIEDQMRTALKTRDVTISELQGKLTVNILDRVLFASGEAELKPEGQQVLSQVASVLNQHTNRQIYVIGHTDNIPIRANTFSRYASNWELSTARATSAVRYLVETAGINPARMAAVGYGEFHPVADNSTAEGRAKNRRIAIVIMPEQFNPLDQTIETNITTEIIEPVSPPTNAAPQEIELLNPVPLEPSTNQ
jgi:chemotaxis protein MotB